MVWASTESTQNDESDLPCVEAKVHEIRKHDRNHRRWIGQIFGADFISRILTVRAEFCSEHG